VNKLFNICFKLEACHHCCCCPRHPYGLLLPAIDKLVHLSSELCRFRSYDCTPDESLRIWFHVHNDAHRPVIPWRVFVLNQYDVIYFHISLLLASLWSLLECTQMFFFPSRPELVAEMLDPAPMAAHVNIVSLKFAWRGKNNLGLHSQDLAR